MWYCETCKTDLNINIESFRTKPPAHIENEVISRINNDITDKTYRYINPDFEKVDNQFKRAFDVCTQHFDR